MYQGGRDGSPQIQDEKLAAKRRRVLDAARRHFMAQGYSDTGIEAVARDAKVSTATLYALFPSKTHLFNAVIDEAGQEFAGRIAAVSASGGDPLEQLRGFASAYARFMSDPFVRSVFRLVAAERRRFTPVAQTMYDLGRNRFGAALMGILERLRADGRFAGDRLATAAGQLMGMIEHPTFLVPLVTGGEVECTRSPDQVAQDAVDTLMARYGVGK